MTSILTSIFGLTSSFIDVTCSKIPKNAIFRKSAEKVLEKWGGGLILTDYFESYPKIKICTKFSIFDVNFTRNLRNIELSQAKRLSYLLELFCWHILGGFKKNPRNGFSENCQKWPKMPKNGQKWLFFA